MRERLTITRTHVNTPKSSLLDTACWSTTSAYRSVPSFFAPPPLLCNQRLLCPPLLLQSRPLRYAKYLIGSLRWIKPGQREHSPSMTRPQGVTTRWYSSMTTTVRASTTPKAPPECPVANTPRKLLCTSYDRPTYHQATPLRSRSPP